MIAHQPDYQSGIESTQIVPLAEFFGIDSTQLGVITAATFGDIVIKPGDIEQFDFWAFLSTCHSPALAMALKSSSKMIGIY